ncbi:hypothetical protein [Sorangium sp. So ce362]|uniref:hypothetical protein n=1 Tax=Sorangium sp. So ce362 TaxID=3133303 RepID=UPI003F61CB15
MQRAEHQLEPKIREIIDRVEHRYPGDAGLLAAIDLVAGTLDELPREFAFDADPDLRLATLEANRVSKNEALLLVAQNLHGWLGFAVYATVFKTSELVDDVISGLNDARPLRVVTAARSLMEHAAVLNSFYRDVAQSLDLLGSSAFRDVVRGLVEGYGIALRFAQSTRFNWAAGIAGDLDRFYDHSGSVDGGSKATNVLTLIDKLPQTVKGGTAFFYGMLCDFVHPNGASHMLTARIVMPLPGGRMRYELARPNNSDEAYEMVVHVIAIPVRESLLLLTGQLLDLEHRRRILSETIGMIRSAAPPTGPIP